MSARGGVGRFGKPLPPPGLNSPYRPLTLSVQPIRSSRLMKEKALLAEIIQKVNGLFEGELSDNDQLVYLNGALKGKLLENDTLDQQAANNSKEQIANSP